MLRSYRGIVLVAVAALTTSVLAGEESAPKAAPTHPGLEKLKALAGEWVMAAPPVEKNAAGETVPAECDTGAAKGAETGKPGADAGAAAAASGNGTHEHGQESKSKGDAKPADEQPAIVYRVIAAGSAVHEHMFPGTGHEMVTIYHLDGPDLLLTHYCAAGNQPRMKAEKSADPNQLVFRFAGGTNLDAAKDMHMHDLTITFIDADHIRQEWTHYKDGKPTGTVTFELKRLKH